MTIYLFWTFVLLIVFVYAGYPVLIWAAGTLRGREVRKGNALPKVTILISAHNEEREIAATLENKLTLDYPRHCLEVIVISDASTDRTDEIVRSYERRGVQLLVQSERKGKTCALNWAAENVSSDLIVFSDANSIYHRDALKMLVRNFSDPTVGYVTGKMVYVDKSGSLVGSGCSAYMRYENWLRELETRTGSVVGVDGGIDVVRRSLYTEMPANLLPDFLLPLRVVERGYRVVYDPDALLYEQSLRNVGDELKMRVRVILRSLHTLWFMKKLFNPLRYGLFALQFLIHKALRYLVGLIQSSAFVSNALILGEGRLYVATFLAQVVFYSLALFGYFLSRYGRRVGLLYYSYYFCLLNGASVIALWKFARGDQMTVWSPRKGE